MNILITGSNGFIGKNLSKYLREKSCHNIIPFNKTDKLTSINFGNIDFVIHLAAVHRSNNENDFIKYNINFTEDLISACSTYNVPIIYTSSIQSDLKTPYGESKKVCEKMIENYRNKSKYCKIFKLTNTFGEYSNPNHLSVVSTFCYNISHDKPVTIHDHDKIINFTYIGDVVKRIAESISYIYEPEIISIQPQYSITLTKLYSIIKDIKNGSNNSSDLEEKLRMTYNYFKGLA